MLKRFLLLGSLSIAILILSLSISRYGKKEFRADIVTTFYPVTEFTRAIAGERLKITQLVPSGQEVHDYQVVPSNIIDLSGARLLIKNGSGLEDEWLDSLLKSANNPDLEIFSLADFVDLIRLDTDEAEDEHLSTDPHIWLSPKNAMVFIDQITQALSRLDPVGKDYYQANESSYLQRLQELDQQITSEVRQFPQKEFIAFHDAFSYFARDYGLKQLAAIELVPGQAPTPGELTEIKKLITQYHIKGLFSEPQFSPAVIEQLSKELALPIYTLDPLETDNNDSYIQGMQQNLANLSQVLGG